MKAIKYLALLRGINVGGNNIIKMDELKNLFAELGFTEVQTYIQSGNVIFTDTEKDKAVVTAKIEKMLAKKLKNRIIMALLTFSEVKELIAHKPEGFGDDPENKYDVLFLAAPATAKDAIKQIKTREGVDRMYQGKKVLYIARSKTNLTKSYFSKIVESPVYQNITIRNWNTTKKLCEIMHDNG